MKCFYKKIFVMTILLAMSGVCAAQEVSNADSLVSKLDAIPTVPQADIDASVSAAMRLKDTQRQGKLEELKIELEGKQLLAIKACCKINSQFALGSSAIDNIINKFSFGMTFAQMSSPFSSEKFKKSYGKWHDGWWQYIPAVAGAVVPMFFNNNKGESLSIGLSVGASLTAILSGFGNSQRTKTLISENLKMFEDSLVNNMNTDFVNVVELMDFNNIVYDDIQKIEAMCKLVKQYDDSLTVQYGTFSADNDIATTMLDKNIPYDARFLTLIENSYPYFERFQSKLEKANEIFEYAERSFTLYSIRLNDLLAKNPNNEYLQEVRKAIDKYNEIREKDKEQWNFLREVYLKIKPADMQKLRNFYQLEENKKFINNSL
jgi:hypothetical protein